MTDDRFDKILKVVSKIANLKSHGKAIVLYIKRVIYLDEEKEAKQLRNLKKYLEVAKLTLEAMREAGCTEEEVRQTAIQLYVPAVQVTREALVVARQLGITDELGEAIEDGDDEFDSTGTS